MAITSPVFSIIPVNIKLILMITFVCSKIVIILVNEEI